VRVLESVPNFSEGRERTTIDAIGAALSTHARLLDVHADEDHNRSVFTLVGDDTSLVESLLAGIDCARERIARLVCADVEQLAAEEIDAIAAHLYTEQLRQIETAARRVSERVGGAAPVVPLGGGAFLARAAAQRLERAVVELPWSAAERDAAPAAALAALLAERGP